MSLAAVNETDYAVFHKLLTAYYREGEDAETPQEQLNGFVQYLFDLCLAGKISGCIAYDPAPVGFVLWNIDSADGLFSNKPGYGTILEIGVSRSARNHGLGKLLVDHAESGMSVPNYYVCAYGPAERFWEKCGYVDSGELAENGLKLMVKGECDGR